MTQLIATNQLTLTNVNDGQSIKDNLFSATNFALTKYAHPSQPTVLVSWKYNGKPNTKYTLSTDVTRNAEGMYQVFFGVYPSTPSSFSNGVAINEPRTITTDATGIIEITARMGTADSIIAKTRHVKLEENDIVTAFIFHPDDQIGDKGTDGKTAVVHWAYSNNADGTGLTTSDNGQRYIGQYSDYTQADSTDKTKYRWADRWANIDVGGTNQISLTGALVGYRVGFGGDNYTDSLHTLTKFIPVKYSNYVLSYDGELNNNTNYYYSLGWYSAPDVSGFISRPTGAARQAGLINGIKLTPPANATYLRVSFPTNFNKVMLNGGTVKLNWSQSPEDIQAELEKVVYKTDISVTDEGIVHSASKTVNGQTIASMIAQRAEWVEIIANLLKVKGDMIVDGTIGANKLSVSTLSALAADLGQISGGSLELLESVAQGTSVDAWGNFTIPAHKWGLYIDNIGAISSGTPVRKSSSESTASDMPVAVLTSGQLRFARVNQNNDLGSVLHNGLSDPDNATISFDVASDGTKQLLIQANGQIVNQGTNYTNWISTGVSGVFYKRQGDVVALKMQVATTANQTFNLGNIPVALLPIPNNGTMMRVTAWTADQALGRNLQINQDGSMVLLPSGRGDTFNTQVTWII